MTYDPTRPVRQQITDQQQEALSQPVPRRSLLARIAAWFSARLGGKSGATNGGYWGGVTFWDRLKAAAATAFLRRR